MKALPGIEKHRQKVDTVYQGLESGHEPIYHHFR